MNIRPAEPQDGQTALGWHRSRGLAFSPDALPKIGVVAEDEHGPAGALWCYLDNSVGVGFVEHLVMRPGLSLAQAAQCGREMLQCIEAAPKSLGYGLLVANVLPGCARFLPAVGWESGDSRPKQTMLKLL